MPALAYTAAAVLAGVCVLSAVLGARSADPDHAGGVLASTLAGSLSVVTFAITAITA